MEGAAVSVPGFDEWAVMRVLSVITRIEDIKELFPRSFLRPVFQEQVVSSEAVYLADFPQEGRDEVLGGEVEVFEVGGRVGEAFVDEDAVGLPFFVVDDDAAVDEDVFDVLDGHAVFKVFGYVVEMGPEVPFVIGGADVEVLFESVVGNIKASWCMD